MRSYSRTSEQMRPIRMTPNYTGNATGSVLIEYGETKVICTVMVEDGVPGFLRSAQPPQGWLTAEYSMLPGATGTRSKRDRQTVSGRTQEIQRLIGRSIRGVFDLTAFQDLTFHIDCDVIQADGGTRTASITGAYVALKIAVQKLMRQGKLKRNPLKGGLAAVSIGLSDQGLLVDLDYKEDSSCRMDMNVVLTHSSEFLELQGPAERGTFNRDHVTKVMDLAQAALAPVFDLQNRAADGETVEG